MIFVMSSHAKDRAHRWARPLSLPPPPTQTLPLIPCCDHSLLGGVSREGPRLLGRSRRAGSRQLTGTLAACPATCCGGSVLARPVLQPTRQGNGCGSGRVTKPNVVSFYLGSPISKFVEPTVGSFPLQSFQTCTANPSMPTRGYLSNPIAAQLARWAFGRTPKRPTSHAR